MDLNFSASVGAAINLSPLIQNVLIENTNLSSDIINTIINFQNLTSIVFDSFNINNKKFTFNYSESNGELNKTPRILDGKFIDDRRILNDMNNSESKRKLDE
jgi:hypothetical protein